jgi:hypothetical protein
MSAKQHYLYRKESYHLGRNSRRQRVLCVWCGVRRQQALHPRGQSHGLDKVSVTEAAALGCWYAWGTRVRKVMKLWHGRMSRTLYGRIMCRSSPPE